MQVNKSKMLSNTSERLASIQTKIETINEKLEAGRLYSISSCDSESISVFERTRSLFRLAMERQSFYAHFFKLIALFSIAVAHLIYMQSFLDAYSVMEDYTFKIHARYAPVQTPSTTLAPINQMLDQLSSTTVLPSATSGDKNAPTLELNTLNPTQLANLNMMNSQMDLLADYRRNNWMVVACLCISLCTSSFFLFILPITEVCKSRELIMGVVDLVSFAVIPLLLTTRIFIVDALNQSLEGGLRGAHKLLSAERLMNLLQCTIYPRENLQFCAEVVMSTIFPVLLLKYLIILSVLTLVYVGVAYLIEYCVRHWFPHKHPSQRKCRRSLRHSCCVCAPNSAKLGYNRCPSMSSVRPLRPYQNRSYVPMLLDNNLIKPSVKPVVPLLCDTDQHLVEDQHSVTESIPAEPLPTFKV